MRLPYYHVDAFTSQPFRGNPAGVCLLDQWLPDTVLRNIAAENNLSAAPNHPRPVPLIISLAC